MSVSSSVSDGDNYVMIRKLLYSVFQILLAIMSVLNSNILMQDFSSGNLLKV
jgi:hypothetical protein